MCRVAIVLARRAHTRATRSGRGREVEVERYSEHERGAVVALVDRRDTDEQGWGGDGGGRQWEQVKTEASSSGSARRVST